MKKERGTGTSVWVFVGSVGRFVESMAPLHCPIVLQWDGWGSGWGDIGNVPLACASLTLRLVLG